MSAALRQYALVTFNYWAFTLTDGALRMLVVLYFHGLGYSPLQVAMLFLFYEFFGVVTNLLGGWLGARIGLNRTMNIGLGLQVLALAMLWPTEWLSVAWVMCAQALSGIAKDLNKMSAKSAIKTLLPEEESHQLYRWVALLTGSKNALKGVGFFLGGALLSGFGFQTAIGALAAALVLVWLASVCLLSAQMGRAKRKPKFRQIFSKSPRINRLSAARLCLFAARDVWFVVAVPVYLATQAGWQHWAIGSFMAAWVIAYGAVQAYAPKLTGQSPDGASALRWASVLMLVPLLMALGLTAELYGVWVLLLGLLLFGAVFALNSSLHSYLIVHYARGEGVSLDVGFYYMANAAGRLLGTVLSGWVFQAYGLAACLWLSFGLLAATAALSKGLPQRATATPA